jgi:hyperosmotically inducible protein
MVATYPACAQNAASTSPQNRSASESMSLAGHETKNAATNAYEGTATAVKDTAITAKVKVALHNDKVTGQDDIHVDTVAGIVTLGGQVGNEEEAEHAAQIARSTSGVRDIVNNLRIKASNS